MSNLIKIINAAMRQKLLNDSSKEKFIIGEPCKIMSFEMAPFVHGFYSSEQAEESWYEEQEEILQDMKHYASSDIKKHLSNLNSFKVYVVDEPNNGFSVVVEKLADDEKEEKLVKQVLKKIKEENDDNLVDD